MPLADSTSLLGKLQRGRGDAVRTLLALDSSEAQEILVDCLCTELDDTTDMVGHTVGYVELIQALSPDLSRWHHWLDKLEPCVTSESWCLSLHVLLESATSGFGPNVDYLCRYLLGGPHRTTMFEQAVMSEFRIPLETWRSLLPGLNEQTLEKWLPHDHTLDWKELSKLDPRVAKIGHERGLQHASYRARTVWSKSNYDHATFSQMRMQVLKDLHRTDPASAQPYVVEGLWDGHSRYRENCVKLCALDRPDVMLRLEELATNESLGCSEAAKERLGRT